MTLQERINALMNGATVNVGSDAVAKAMAKHQEKKAEALGESIVTVLGNSDRLINAAVERLRQIRKMEKEQREFLENLALSVEYFKATGNPLPMSRVGVNINAIMQTLGETFPPMYDKGYEIPNDWEPPKAE